MPPEPNRAWISYWPKRRPGFIVSEAVGLLMCVLGIVPHRQGMFTTVLGNTHWDCQVDRRKRLSHVVGQALSPANQFQLISAPGAMGPAGLDGAVAGWAGGLDSASARHGWVGPPRENSRRSPL